MAHTDVHLPWHVKSKDPYWATVYKNHACGCHLCVGQFDRKLNRRRDRATQRAILAELVKCETDQWDVDTHIPRADKWSLARSRYGYNVLGKGPDGNRNTDTDSP